MKKQKPNKPKLIKMNYSFMSAPYTFVQALILPVIASFIFAIFASILGAMGGVSYADLMSSPLMVYGTILLTPLVFLYIVLHYSKKQNVSLPLATGLNKTLEPTKILLVILISVISVLLLSPFISMVDHLFSLFGFSPDSSLPIDLNNAWQLIAAIFALAVVPAVVEELLFRGVILNGLLSKLKPHLAVVLSAVMFMLVHGSLQQTVYQFILGLVFGYVFLATRKITYTIVLHFFNNLIVVVSAYMVANSNTVADATVYATFADYAMPVVWAVIAGAIIWFSIILLQYGSFRKYLLVKNHKNKLPKQEKNIMVISEKNKETNMSMVIEMQAKPKTFANLNTAEKRLFWFSIALSVLLWVLQTIYLFLD